MITLSQKKLDTLKKLIGEGKENKFYSWRCWRNEIRPAVLKMDNYECQICKSRGQYAPAEIVHHVKHLDTAPELALSIYDPETGARQLISVCKSCHEELHPEALQIGSSEPVEPLTPERWD